MSNNGNEEDSAKLAEIVKEAVKDAIVKRGEALPEQVIALPLNQRPVFPSMMLPLLVPEGRLADAMKVAIDKSDGWVVFFLTKEPIDDGAEFTFR